jgi:hypothetical protein
LVGEIVIATIAWEDGKKSPQLVDINTTNNKATTAAKTDLFSDLILRTRSSRKSPALPEGDSRQIHLLATEPIHFRRRRAT